MKKAAAVICLVSIGAALVYGQHKVNDVKSSNGWYKVSIEADENGYGQYAVTQCYPNGDEYRLSDDERKKVPLWVKVLCIAMFEKILEGKMDDLSFSMDGIYARMAGFILMIDSSKSDDEILAAFEPEAVAAYKDRDW